MTFLQALRRRFAIAGIMACFGPAPAQLVTPVTVANMPASDGVGDDAPASSDGAADESGKAVDVGGLSGRGGTALQGRATFRETIGTPIYTPIGTPIFTPVQRPPETGDPR